MGMIKMEYNLLKIKPTDNTFFGTGNQFNYEINNILKSMNIAYPSTFFGGIFTAILSKNKSFRQEFFQKKYYDHEKILEIRQIYLYNEIENKFYIKAPLDLFFDKDNKNEIKLGKFKKCDDYTCLKYNYYLSSDKSFEKVKDCFIELEFDLESYVKNEIFLIELKNENEIFSKNNKIGISIDKKTKNVEMGKLYKIQQTEFIKDEWSFVVEYKINKEYLKNKYELKGLDLDSDLDLKIGFLKLGGENKVCKYENIESKEIKKFQKLIEDDQKILKKGFYKIILTSDSYFTKDINQIFENKNIELLSIVNDKPIYIGGYDMEKRNKESSNEKGIRRMYKGYSAGSIFLVEIKEDNIDLNECIKNYKGFNNYIVVECNNIEEETI
jgi:CRISPR-associated protein Cmr3